jgi:hypothetical protein
MSLVLNCFIPSNPLLNGVLLSRVENQVRRHWSLPHNLRITGWCYPEFATADFITADDFLLTSNFVSLLTVLLKTLKA